LVVIRNGRRIGLSLYRIGIWATFRTRSDPSIPELQIARFGIAATDQLHELLRRALIVAHDRGALLRHRACHLLAGFAGCACIANTDVTIAHDGYPSLDGELRQRGTNRKSCTAFD
jgi:hypothetical protein